MAETQRLRIGSSVGNLPEVVSWIEGFCAAHPPASAFEHKLQLVAEELLMNTIMHGYGKERSNASIWLTLHPQPEGVAFIIEDEAPPFDPLKEGPPPDTNAALGDRPIGGLGVMLVREMTDHASYSRDRYNRLTLVFGPGPLPDGRTDGKRDGNRPATGFPVRPRGLTLRILAILLFLPVAGLIAAGALNYLKFERILTETAAARYDPVLRELVRAINDSLQEGLTLASTKTTENLIERSVTQFEGAFDLVVHDIDGTALFSTLGDDGNNAGTDSASPPPPGEIHHESSGLDRFTGRMTILQDGVPVGVLSLSHDATGAKDALPDLTMQLQRAGAVAVFPVIPLLIIATLIIFGRIEARFHNRTLAIERAAQPDSPDPGATDPLVQAVWRVSWPSAAPGRST